MGHEDCAFNGECGNCPFSPDESDSANYKCKCRHCPELKHLNRNYWMHKSQQSYDQENMKETDKTVVSHLVEAENDWHKDCGKRSYPCDQQSNHCGINVGGCVSCHKC